MDLYCGLMITVFLAAALFLALQPTAAPPFYAVSDRGERICAPPALGFLHMHMEGRAGCSQNRAKYNFMQMKI